MTVPSTVTKDVYEANGVNRDWPITFTTSGIGTDEVKVYVTTDGVSQLITSDYEVDLSIPTVTYPTIVSGLDPVDAGKEVVILRQLNLKQETDYKNQGTLPAETIEEGQDRAIMSIQQMQEQLNRALLNDVNAEDPVTFQDLVDAVAAADAYAASAAGLASDAADSASDAAGSASDAAGSASDAAGSASDAAGYASSVNIKGHTQTFDADDLTAGVLTLTTPTGYTVIKFYKIYDENGEEIGSPDGFDRSSLEMDFSSLEDAGILTSATTWTIESFWGPTV